MSKKLIEALVNLDEDSVLKEVKELKEKKVETPDIIAFLQEGMAGVGKKYESEEYFLSELIMSADIFKMATAILGESAKAAEYARKNGTFVLGTIYDDIHDIGKNIVASIMSANGFDVVDIGIDVPTAKFIEAIKLHKPQIVGISCLLTTAFDNIKEAIASIEKAGLRKDIKILIGGGTVDASTCKYVNADAFCKSAQEAVDVSKNYLKIA
ncbi:MAG: cobalamin-dependent protein [Spirochaetes bacterium]|nr:cobalamin-dependent protein [Spirochaetota bacterium]